MRFYFLFLSFSLLSLQTAFGQQETACGTVPTEEQIEFMRQIDVNAFRARTANSIINVPLKIHIIRRSDGTGGLTPGSVTQAINTANDYYVNSGIQFFQFEDINFIDNDDLFDLNSSQEGIVANPNDVKDVVNVYFSNTLSAGFPLCGYTRFPPSVDRVFMSNQCVFGGTFEHELGHYFTLYHTHGKTNTGTTDELADGSNCLVAGDDICDTPADPNLSGKVDPGTCTYTGEGGVDANGDGYNPLVNNIMAYSLDRCQDAFTADQYARIRSGLLGGRAYLRITTSVLTALFSSTESEICPGSSVNFRANSSGATSFNWSFPGGSPSTSTRENPVITYSDIGKYSVTLTVGNSTGSQASTTRTQYVIVDNPGLKGTNDSTRITLDNGSLDSRVEIVNPDNRLTFELSDVDSEAQGGSGSLTVNNFLYATDQERNVDDVILPIVSPVGVRGFRVEFSYAYTYFPTLFDGVSILPARYDSLEVLLRSKCGGATQSLWIEGGEDLATAVATNEDFVPSENDWQRKSVDFRFTQEFDFALIALRNISYNGNNLYIDNIEVIPDYSLEKPLGLRIEAEENGFTTLSWRDMSINEMGFSIEKSTDGQNYVSVDTVEANVNTYTIDEGSLEGNAYYRVRAIGIKGFQSLASSEIMINVLSSEVDNSDIVLYPNPFRDFISLRGVESGSYQIYSFTGKLLKDGKFEVGRIDGLDDLSAGMYLLTLKDVNNENILFRSKIYK